MNSAAQTFSVLLIGSREVGKSKLLDRLKQNPFTDSYDLTENNQSQSYTLQIDSISFTLNITEMSKVLYKIFEAQPVPHFDYIIFVYDLSKISTWYDIKKYKEQLQKYIGEDSESKYFIIGNKSDKENLMDPSKVKFFAPHLEISAKSQSLNPKEICKEIFDTAQQAKYVNKKPVYNSPPPAPEQYFQTEFKASTPTTLTRIEGVCNADRVIKIIFVGSPNVGKSEINSLLAKQPFKPQYIATIGVDFKILNVRHQDKIYKLQCWQMSGNKKFRLITQNYYKASSICVYVYDITNRYSFQEIQEFYSEMNIFNQAPVEKYLSILIGNKSDLQSQRAVTFEEGMALAAQIGATFYETSVKQRHGVLEAFLTTVEEYINTKKFDQ